MFLSLARSLLDAVQRQGRSMSVETGNSEPLSTNYDARMSAGESANMDVSPADHRWLVGASPAIAAVRQLVARAARAQTTVLLTGEKGSGKERVARQIHSDGARGRGPFIKLCCDAWPEKLLEAELFGGDSRPGDAPSRLARAAGGTLLFDEIAAISVPTQIRLARLLRQQREARINNRGPTMSDVRVIAATEKDLQKLMKRGAFRPDLFYALSVLPIDMPPLRARREDIPALAEHFRATAVRKHGMSEVLFAIGCHQRLAVAPWPGNVRQLINIVERLVVLSEGSVITTRDVERELNDETTEEVTERTSGVFTSLAMRRYQAERSAILGALAEADGNRTKTATILGISRRSLYDKLTALGLHRRSAS